MKSLTNFDCLRQSQTKKDFCEEQNRTEKNKKEEIRGEESREGRTVILFNNLFLLHFFIHFFSHQPLKLIPNKNKRFQDRALEIRKSLLLSNVLSKGLGDLTKMSKCNTLQCMKEKKIRTLAFRPSPKILEEMERVCEIRGLSKTQVIEKALEAYLFFPEIQNNEQIREAIKFLYAASVGTVVRGTTGTEQEGRE